MVNSACATIAEQDATSRACRRRRRADSRRRRATRSDQHRFNPPKPRGTRLRAADQPPHAGEIENADPQPVPQAVIRYAGAARPVDHVDIADRRSPRADQRRQEAMQPVEIGQRQEDVAAERLQAAAGVARAVPQHRAAHAVGDARLQLLEAGVLAPDALAGDQADARRRLLQRARAAPE